MLTDPPALAVDDFAQFVEAVHGHQPFPWQQRLLRGAVEGGWPDAIRVPTGLGKTTVVDVAAFALAIQAHMPPRERTARTRTFIIVDRRLVVDDITSHAQWLRDRLDEALGHSAAGSVVNRVARRLHQVATGHNTTPEPAALHAAEIPPLVVTRMRGGTTWEARWVSRPEQPAVIVGTVDQLASRLLFRGYGVTRSSRPIDAALVGSDALIILDEAHLARPLRATLAALQRWEQSVERPVLRKRPATTVVMSATVDVAPDDTARHPQILDVGEDDQAHPEAGKRLRARKWAVLWEAGAGGPSAKARQRLGDVLARAAQRLGELDDIAVVGVVANTVATARRVHELLRVDGHDTELLIGPTREVDRHIVVERIRPRAGIGRQPGPDRERPLFVVATQTIEVGVNLDFDALVTEAAPLDALAQRLGRVDRLGNRTDRGLRVPVVIVHSGALHPDDPVYGEPLERTWAWLAQRATVAEIKRKTGPDTADLHGELDLGPQGLRGLTRGHDTRSLATAHVRVPTVFPQDYALGWSQTAPVPRADVDIVPFIRGDVKQLPTVSLLWRADITGDTEHLARAAQASLALRPPCSQEQVEVPLWHARRWLEGRAPGEEVPLADRSPVNVVVDEAAASEGKAESTKPRAAQVREDGTCEVAEDPRRLMQGALLVCSADAGGLDEFGWNPASTTPVIDVADLCETRGGIGLRVQRSTLQPVSPAAARAVEVWCAEHGDDSMLAVRDFSRAATRSLIAALAEAIRWERAEGATSPYADLLERRILASMADQQRWASRVVQTTDPAGDAGRQSLVLRSRRRRGAGAGGGLPGGLSNTESDEAVGVRDPLGADYRSDADDTASLIDRRVTLEAHSASVRDRARASAERLGLPEDLVAAVGLAAEAHDLGKVDPRFQVKLHGGDAFAYVPGDPPLAKSGMDPSDRAAWRRAERDAGWPAGLPHEALSVALLDAYLEVADDLSVPWEHDHLVRHLVGTHHGQGRPLYEPVAELRLVDLEANWRGRRIKVAARDLSRYVIDWRCPSRFRRLSERHGAWGLALLETIVRLADMNCSEAGT